jgi:hypothetical protein
MNYLRKTWVRVVLSLVLGAILVELDHVARHGGSSGPDGYLLFVAAFFVYCLLTYIVRRRSRSGV